MSVWGGLVSEALVGITVLAALGSWTVGSRVARPREPVAPPAAEARLGARGLLASPGLWLLVVAGLLYVNQVLFTVYVIRVHGGDPSFVARFLPAGWFDLATGNPTLRVLAADFPEPELLAPTVLRVQAFLELPFVLLGYLTACRWLDPQLYLRIARSPLLWLASVSYTLTFCVIEWALRSPYTPHDIVLRALAAGAAPAAIGWMARTKPGRAPPRHQAATSVRGLLAFTASVWAMGLLVLAVYDTALLYNLGHLREWLPAAAVAGAVLVAARLVASQDARRPATHPPPPGIDSIGSALRWFLALFLVLALPARYGAAEPAVQAIGAVTVLAAATAGANEALQRARPRAGAGRAPSTGGWTLRIGIGLLAGTSAASAVLIFLPGGTYPETLLLHSAGTLLLTTTALTAVLDTTGPADRKGEDGAPRP